MIILLTGGTASGKSRMAETICMSMGKRLAYIATMEPFGEEGLARVAKHRHLREGKGFLTWEKYRDLQELHLSAGWDVLLLECVGNLLANEMFRPDPPQDAAGKILAGIMQLTGQAKHTVIVSNMVFSSGEKYGTETREYIDLLGAINRQLAAWADTVVEAVAGLPLVFKGNLIL